MFPQRIVLIPHVAVTAPACEVVACVVRVGVAQPVASAMPESNDVYPRALSEEFMILMLGDVYVTRFTREMTALKVTL